MTENDVGEIVNELQKFELKFPGQTASCHDLHTILSDNINHLITHNFSRLISVLYRLDISEKKLKQLLENAGETSAGDIIAKMIIERQLQKIETRKSFTSDGNFSDEEKW